MLARFARHAPLPIMVAGAGGLFLSTVIMRQVLSPEVFGVFGLTLTFVAFLVSFGLLGSDQAMMRTVRITPETLLVSKSSARALVYAALLAIPLLVVLGYFGVSTEFPWLVLLALVVACQGQLILFNLLRLRSHFISAQLVNNSWRVLLLMATAVIWFLGERPGIETMLAILLISLFLPLIVSAFLVNKKSITFVDDEHPQFLWNFMVSLGITALLGTLDRFLIQRSLGLVAFGDYFYAYTLIVSPFLVLAGYIGFREFVVFKQHFEWPAFRRAVLRLGVVGLVVASLWAVVLVVFHTTFLPEEVGLQEDVSILAFLIFLAAVRLPQALLSAAVGALASRDALRLTNLVQAASICAVVLGVEFLDMGIHQILVAVCLVWIIKAGIYYQTARVLEGSSHAH